MKLLSKLFRRKKTPAQRLFETLHPDPASREKRFAQWPRERQERYIAACFGEPYSLRSRKP